MRYLLAAMLPLLLSVGLASAADRPNVLLIMSDDLAAVLGCYGHPLAQTPNLDRLAAHSLLCERSYCQFPHCNPSRSSMLSGMRPVVTKVTNNEDSLYANRPGVMTLPHLFRNHGYATTRCGKIFHLGVPSGLESMDDPEGWDFGMPFRNEAPFPESRKTAIQVQKTKGAGFPWQETIGDDGGLVDVQFARTAVERLEKRDSAKPFFVAVGFHRPHLPFVAPARFYDLYPMDKIALPEAPADDEADIPPAARNGSVPGYKNDASPEQRRAAIRAYLATVSYVDAQAGYVLDALKRLNLEDKTIVIFVADHGWHLGEHGLWHKRSLFEESARVPLLISVPGMKTAGRRSRSLVELLDVYPTLCDLCGVEPPTVLQGRSLRPLLDNTDAVLHDAAFTEARRGPDAEMWGRSVRTTRWRYTEWNEGRDGRELYDHDADPHEYTNLANDPQHAATVSELGRLLRDGRVK